MSREIKFRGRQITGNFVYGFPIINDEGQMFIVARSHRGAHLENYEVTEQDEFTGLKDKNGVEIYEGDIVQSDDNEEPFLPVEFSQVEIGKDSWQMSHTALCWNVGYRDGSGRPPIIEGKHGDAMYGQYTTELTVVGNIHQNPELLNN